ncbi:MAG: serine hydroxymethyltransferase [Proteobacteria bacterium]|nr:serine hydroxymethyltransferase [Pseudomonadota bacterium]
MSATTPSYESRSRKLNEVDPEIYNLIQRETERQEYGLEMIPSENFVSEAVLEAMSSVLTNKYAEGQPGKRYYGGCQVVDEVENLASARACELFGADFANVQPHSGVQANQAVFEAFLKPGDTFMGLRLDQGGHLSHGSPVNFSGRHYNVIGYGLRPSDCLIDPEQVRSLAHQHKPKLIIAGATAYSRKIDWKLFREVADEVGAILMADIAHYSGLIAGGAYPSPVNYADIVTTTTHKTLRGPRSGMVMGREIHRKAINKAIFPGLQGGPHMHTIAAKAVMFKEALSPDFKIYAARVVENAQALSDALIKRGLQVVSGGTDSHMLVVDLRPVGVTGKVGEETLDSVGITGNKNTVPFDPQPPAICSGVRLGTPALTTRGMGVKEMEQIAAFILEALRNVGNEGNLNSIHSRVQELSKGFPLYKHRLVS